MPLNEELRQFVLDNFLFGRNSVGLADQDSFLAKGIIDSTGVLELVAFLEQRYGIHMQDFDLVPENLDSIENLARFVSTRVAQN